MKVYGTKKKLIGKRDPRRSFLFFRGVALSKKKEGKKAPRWKHASIYHLWGLPR